MRQLLIGVVAFAAIAAVTPASAQTYSQYPYGGYYGGYYGNVPYASPRTHVRVHPGYRAYNQQPRYNQPSYDTDPDPRVRDYLKFDPPGDYN